MVYGFAIIGGIYIQLKYQLSDMSLDRRTIADGWKETQLAVDVEVAWSEGRPTQVAVRVDIGGHAYFVLRHHDNGFNATDDQRSHQQEAERVDHFADFL